VLLRLLLTRVVYGCVVMVMAVFSWWCTLSVFSWSLGCQQHPAMCLSWASSRWCLQLVPCGSQGCT